MRVQPCRRAYRLNPVPSFLLTLALALTVGSSTAPNLRAAAPAAKTVARISLSSSGVEANADSECPVVSADGRFVAFHSQASNLVSDDTNTKFDIFVRNVQLGQTTRISVASDGSQAIGGDSTCASISATGRFVAFHSDATNLVSSDNNNTTDVFVRDRDTDNDGIFDEPGAVSTTRISVNSSGQEADGGSYGATISADGQFVAFHSQATNLVLNDTNAIDDVFVANRQTGAITLVSAALNGKVGNGASIDGRISADGKFVAFSSKATNLISDDVNGKEDVFIRDLQAGTTSCISVNSQGDHTYENAANPTVSADGRFVAFQSYAGNLVPDDDKSFEDVFLRDRLNGTTTLISRSSSGAAATGGNSYYPSISADGRYVGFVSWADNLVPNDGNSTADIFVRDVASGTTTRVSEASDGADGNNESADVGIAPDGNSVAFQSGASNLVSNDLNGKQDIFLYGAPLPTAVSLSDIPDQSTFENSPLTNIPLTVGGSNPDGVALTAASSNPALIPAISFGGSGANRTITITPAETNALSKPTAQGEAVITIHAADSSGTVQKSFRVQVKPPPWLVMLYLAGDDTDTNPSNNTSDPGKTYRLRTLSRPLQDLTDRLAVMQFNPAMRLVIVFDKGEAAPAGGSGDTRVFVRDPDGLTNVTGKLTMPDSVWRNYPPNSELDTGQPSSIRNFIEWSKRTYPGFTHTFLSIVDHGGGWAPDFGGGIQPRVKETIQAGGWRGMSLDMTANSSLSTRATGQALANVLDGGRDLDVVFFDACLMGMIESAYEIRDTANYFVAGENLFFAVLPYERYLSKEVLRPDTNPRTFASALVAEYKSSDNAITDTETNPFTIAAFDLQQLRNTTPNNLAVRINTLADRMLAALPPSPVALNNPVRSALTAAYRAAQKFDYDNSLTLDKDTDGYVDLVDFARHLQDPALRDIPGDVQTAAAAVVEATASPSNASRVIFDSRTISGEYGGVYWDLSGANGVSIFLPLGEQDFRPTAADELDPTKPAKPERQLTYYTNNCFVPGGYTPCQQLAFTRDAPRWADLLVRLEANTPLRAPGARELRQAPGSARPFNPPSQLPPLPQFTGYLPLIVR